MVRQASRRCVWRGGSRSGRTVGVTDHARHLSETDKRGRLLVALQRLRGYRRPSLRILGRRAIQREFLSCQAVSRAAALLIGGSVVIHSQLGMQDIDIHPASRDWVGVAVWWGRTGVASKSRESRVIYRRPYSCT